jgi:hypothetical protein
LRADFIQLNRRDAVERPIHRLAQRRPAEGWVRASELALLNDFVVSSAREDLPAVAVGLEPRRALDLEPTTARS